MPLLTLNFSCESVKYPARKHFAKTNMTYAAFFMSGEHFCRKEIYTYLTQSLTQSLTLM